jgi:uncharacterized lipoprotein YbaY
VWNYRRWGSVPCVLACLLLLGGCGGGGGGGNPPPPSITISPAAATVPTGKTQQFTASVAATWSVNNVPGGATGTGTISSSGLYTAPALPDGTTLVVTVAATSQADPTAKASAQVTVTTPPAPLGVSVAPGTGQVQVNQTLQLSATVTGGSGNATVAWTVNGVSGGNTTVGTVSPSGLSVTYTAPAIVPSPATVTIAATATDSTGSASGSATVTIGRTISISFSSGLINHEISLDLQGAIVGFQITLSGVQPGDSLNVLSTFGSVVTTDLQVDPGQTTKTIGEIANFLGTAYIPGPVKFWVTGTDGTVSKPAWLFFTGSLQQVVEDTSSGELYYLDRGDATASSWSFMKFKSDGTSDGSFHRNGSGIAFDSTTGYLIVGSYTNGTLSLFDSKNIVIVNGFGIQNYAVTMGTSDSPIFAVAANGGIACVSQLLAGTASCIKESLTTTYPVMLASGLNQPAAITMPDPNHLAVYTRGDSTLSKFDLSSGTAAVPAGTLALPGFTPYDTAFKNTYPLVRGWYLATVGSNIAVMGQTVNADGTVSQRLAIVNGTTMTQIGDYVTLPPGSFRMVADAADNAVIVEYPDISGDAPVTRVAAFSAATGAQLNWSTPPTSDVVPAAGFLYTSQRRLVFCVEGRCDVKTPSQPSP